MEIKTLSSLRIKVRILAFVTLKIVSLRLGYGGLQSPLMYESGCQSAASVNFGRVNYGGIEWRFKVLYGILKYGIISIWIVQDLWSLIRIYDIIIFSF